MAQDTKPQKHRPSQIARLKEKLETISGLLMESEEALRKAHQEKTRMYEYLIELDLLETYINRLALERMAEREEKRLQHANSITRIKDLPPASKRAVLEVVHGPQQVEQWEKEGKL